MEISSNGRSVCNELIDSGGNVPKRQGHSVVRKIRVLREQLTALDRSLGASTPLLRPALPSAIITGPVSPPPRSRLSAKARASLVLQGRYMGYMRQLKPRQKAQVRKIKEARGVRAAISQAKRLASS